MAIQAALTGHLVLSTLHTNDSASAITRLLDIGVPSYLISATLLGVVAQRLVRTYCPHCKRPVPAEETAWRDLVHPWKLRVPGQLYQADGCAECRMTGFLGRLGVYEMLKLSPGVRRLVGGPAGSEAIRELAYKEGTLPLRIAAARKVAQGLTSVDEALRVTPFPGES
jgi:general secretion pathway protein E